MVWSWYFDLNFQPRFLQNWSHSSRPQQIQNKIKQQPAERYHRIYPVFGKRSIPDEINSQNYRVRRDVRMDEIDKIHLRYHRRTRQDLYGKIEKYLQT